MTSPRAKVSTAQPIVASPMASSLSRLSFSVGAVVCCVLLAAAAATATASLREDQQTQNQQPVGKRHHHVAEREAGLASSDSEPRCRFPEFLQTKKGKPWMMKMHRTFHTINVDGGRIFVRHGSCSRRRSSDSYRRYSSSARYPSSRRRHAGLTADCVRSNYTRMCLEVKSGNRYLVSHQESDFPTTYLCLEFLQRGVSVVQVSMSLYRDKTRIPYLCQDKSMQVDAWPWISDEHYRSPSVGCPITGGYNLQLSIAHPRRAGTYKYYGAHPVNCMDGSTPPIRIESNCVDGEGIKFNFKDESCLPSGAHLSLQQTALCMATWKDGRELFAMLRADNNDRAFFCLRVTLPKPPTTTTTTSEPPQLGRSVMESAVPGGQTQIEELTLFIGWVCPHRRNADKESYPGSDIYKTIGVKAPYMVFRVYDQLVVDNPCSDQLTTCQNHAPFCSHMQCMKTCHKCLSASPSSSSTSSSSDSSSSVSSTPAAQPTLGISQSPGGEGEGHGASADSGAGGADAAAADDDGPSSEYSYSFSPRMGAMMTKKATVENHDRFSVQYAKSQDRPNGDFNAGRGNSRRGGSGLSQEGDGAGGRDGDIYGGTGGRDGESMNGDDGSDAHAHQQPHNQHRHRNSNRHRSGEGAAAASSAESTGSSGNKTTGSGNNQRRRLVNQRKCTFPANVQGTWLQRGKDGEDMTFTVTESTFTHPQVGAMECVTFAPPGESGPLRRVLWSRYDNGCYPRFSCVHFNNPAKSVMRYRLANVQQWPLLLSDDSICGEKNFKDTPDMYQPDDKYSMRPWQVVRRAGKIHKIACILPHYIPKVVSFRDDKGRSGCLVHRTYYSPRAISLTFFPLPPAAQPAATPQPQAVPAHEQDAAGGGGGGGRGGGTIGGERGSATLPLRATSETSEGHRRIVVDDDGNVVIGGGDRGVSSDSSSSSSASSYVMNKPGAVHEDYDRQRGSRGGGGGGGGGGGARQRGPAGRPGSNDRYRGRQQRPPSPSPPSDNGYRHGYPAGDHVSKGGVGRDIYRGSGSGSGSRAADESSLGAANAQHHRHRELDWSYQHGHGHGRSDPQAQLNPYRVSPSQGASARNRSSHGQYYGRGGADASRQGVGHDDDGVSSSSAPRDRHASISRPGSASRSGGYPTARANAYGRHPAGNSPRARTSSKTAATATTNNGQYYNYNYDQYSDRSRWRSKGSRDNDTGSSDKYYYYHRRTRRSRSARRNQDPQEDSNFDFEFVDLFYQFGDAYAEKGDKHRRSGRRGSSSYRNGETGGSRSVSSSSTVSSSLNSMGSNDVGIGSSSSSSSSGGGGGSSSSGGGSSSDLRSRLQVSYDCLAVMTYLDSYKSLLTVTAGDPHEILCWLVVDDLTVVILKTSACNSQTAQRVLSASSASPGPADGDYADHVASILHLQQGRRDCNVMFPSDSARPEPIEFRDEDSETSGAAALSRGDLAVWAWTSLVLVFLIR